MIRVLLSGLISTTGLLVAAKVAHSLGFVAVLFKHAAIGAHSECDCA
jgi:hypothetical protein